MTDAALTAEQLLERMAAIRRQIRREADRPPELAPLSGAQVEIVRLLRRQPGLSVAEAAHQLGLAANTVSTLVGQLVSAGMVVRRTDRSDRRIVQLDLDPDVRRRVQAWRDRRSTAVADAIRRLPATDQRRLAESLDALGRLAHELAPVSETA